MIRNFSLLTGLALLSLTLMGSFCGDEDAMERLREVPEGRLAPQGAVLIYQTSDPGGFATEPSVHRTYVWDGHSYDEGVAFFDAEFASRGWRKFFRLDDRPWWTNEVYEVHVAPSSDGLFVVAVLEALNATH